MEETFTDTTYTHRSQKVAVTSKNTLTIFVSKKIPLGDSEV